MKILVDGKIKFNSSASDESIKTVEDCHAVEPNLYDSMSSVIPDAIKNSGSYFKVLSDLIVESFHRDILKMNDINVILDADSASIESLRFLANKYGIEFPSSYSIQCQRFLLKYFPNFVKIKGTENIVKILHLVGRSEGDFYKIKNFGDYKIIPEYEGYMRIIPDYVNRDRIYQNLNFSQKLINKLTSGGMYLEISIR